MHQSNGLRFDVYERVHLPVDVADIHELEEIELTPYIQVVNQGEQVLLRGNLLLGGVYVSQGETREQRTLEHWIPVEITLPANRVSSLEALSVEVDNFDVDLLSARTLNITGVLSLKGVEARDSSSAQTYAWGDEPFTVVHRRERAAESEELTRAAAEAEGLQGASAEAEGQAVESETYAAAPRGEQADAEPVRARADASEPNEPEDDEEDETAGREDEAASAAANAVPPAAAEAAQNGLQAAEQKNEPAASEPVKWSGFAFAAHETREAEAAQPPSEASQPVRLTDLEEPDAGAVQPAAASPAARESSDTGVREPAELLQESASSSAQAAAEDAGTEAGSEASGAAAAAVLAAAPAASNAEEAPSKPEVKVAVTAKRLPEAPSKPEAQGLSKLLFTNRLEPEHRWNPDAKQAKQEAEQETRSEAPAEEIEWKSLFLGANQEEQFRKVRMCIVQKDDTLDSIAGRYRLNPREIALYNRLSDQSVSEGQVLMIP